MEARIYEVRFMRPAVAIFDLEDRLVRERQGGSTHPRPFGRITLTLIEQVLAGGVRQRITPVFELLLTSSPSGYMLFFGLIRLPGGARRRIQLAAGRYVARVAGDYYLTAYRDDIELPRPASAYFFDLEPNETHPLNR